MGIEQIIKEREEKKGKSADPSDESHPDNQVIETPYFRVEGVRNSISKLELRLQGGATLAIEYSMMPVIFSPSNAEIVIPIMINLKITISGNNLGVLKMYLTDSRVKWIRQHYGTKPPFKDDDLFIESIKVEAAEFNESVENLKLD